MTRPSIFRSVNRSFLVTVLTLLVAVCLILFYGQWQDYHHKREQLVKDNLNAQYALLQGMARGIATVAESRLRKLDDDLRAEVFYRLQEAIDIAYSIYESESLRSDERTVKRLIAETLRGIRYRHGAGYYFIDSLSDQALVLYPPDRSVEGKPFKELDEKWRTLRGEFVRLIEAYGDGFHSYAWFKGDGSDGLYAKTSFVKRFAPFDWYIGTGLYRDDMLQEVQAEIVRDVEALHANAGNVVLLDAQQAVLAGGEEVPPGVYVPGEFRQVGEALYYAEKIADLDWIFGVRADVGFINSRIAEETTTARRQALVQLVQILVAIGVLCALFFALIRKLNRNVQENFESFVRTFQVAARSSQLIPLECFDYRELNDLVTNANHVIEENRESREGLNELNSHLEELVEERTQALQESQAKLIVQEKMAVLGRLTATVSHELRNPLATIRNALFNLALAKQEAQPEIMERSLEVAVRNVDRCDRIIGELLDFSRSHPPELKPEPVDPLLEEWLSEWELPGEISLERSLTSGAVAPLDRERFRRAFLNLIVNARQALQESGQQHKHIHVATRLLDGRVEISVRDNGPGIPKELREKIFEPLFSTKNFGVGLGMPIVKDIMEKHHGGVRLHDDGEPGCCMVLWLPVLAPAQEKESAVEEIVG